MPPSRSRSERLELHHLDVHRCEDCGDPTSLAVGTYWLAPDELWAEVVGDGTIVLCPVCFYERADNEGIHISWRAVRDDCGAQEADGGHPMTGSDRSIFQPMLVIEAIHSVAMEHTHGPSGCDVCAASRGDQEALLRVFTAVADIWVER